MEGVRAHNFLLCGICGISFGGKDNKLIGGLHLVWEYSSEYILGVQDGLGK